MTGGAATGISYVVTVYNKAPYLAQVVAGLLAQEGDFARELIFVDDGSTDASPALLAELTAGLPACRILRQANQGPAVATNAGVAEARLPFLKLLDGDDVLLPWASRRLLAAADPDRAILVHGDGGHYEPGAPLPPLRPAPSGPAAARSAGDALAHVMLRNPFSPSAALMRTADFVACGGCDVRVFTQDYTLALRLALRVDFRHLPELLFLSPREEATRLSGNQRIRLRESNEALGLLLDDHPELAPRYRRLAARRAAGRAWKWQRRRCGAGLESRHFRHYLQAFWPWQDQRALIRATLAAFA